MRVTIEIEDEDVPSHYEIQSCRDTKSKIVKNSVNDPVVVHLQAVDFHVINEFCFFLHHQVMQHQWHHKSQTNWISDQPCDIQNLLHFFIYLGVEWHELLSWYNIRFIKVRSEVSIIHPISQRHSSLWRSDNKSCGPFVMIISLVVNHAHLRNSIISVILEEAHVVNLQAIS